MSLVLYGRDAGTDTLDRSERLNALSREMMRDLRVSWDDEPKDYQARAVPSDQLAGTVRGLTAGIANVPSDMLAPKKAREGSP